MKEVTELENHPFRKELLRLTHGVVDSYVTGDVSIYSAVRRIFSIFFGSL